MKPLFDKDNMPPAKKAANTTANFSPMLFVDVVAKPNIQDPVRTSTLCSVLDPTLSDVEVSRIHRIVLEIKNSPNPQQYASEIVNLITYETEKVFQHVTNYSNDSGSKIIQDFVDMVNQFAACKKQTALSLFAGLFSDKKTFADLIQLLRQSLPVVKQTEIKFATEIDTLKKKQLKIDDASTTCMHYLNYVRQYAIAGRLYLEEFPNSPIINVVEKLESVYPATLNTSIAQLVLLSKTNHAIESRMQDIIQFKIPQWKQNTASILVIAEQKKLLGINVEVESNFDALLKLI
jgi:hypothetical protein